eukprot:1586392-Rhodomonas_salina.1
MTVQKIQTAKAQYDVTGMPFCCVDGVWWGCCGCVGVCDIRPFSNRLAALNFNLKEHDPNKANLAPEHEQRLWAMLEGAVLNNGS